MREHLDPALVGGLVPGGVSAIDESKLIPCATAYVTQVARTANLSVRNERELRTLAMSIDMMANGQVLSACDVLMQRFKAVELAASENNWSLATHLELLPPQIASATSTAEREAVASLELAEERLRNAIGGRGGQNRSGRGGRGGQY